VPEFPDIVIYIEALEERILGQELQRALIQSPYLLRTVTPPLQSAEGRKVTALRRIGKRICIGLEGDLWLVLHLMIAGRLHWRDKDRAKAEAKAKIKKSDITAFEFPNGMLTLTEAGSRKRASLHVVSGEAGLEALDPGGADLFAIDPGQFAKILRSENHTAEASTYRSALVQRNWQCLLR
jgi:formamidopyrimidine-DNA glycosylase